MEIKQWFELAKEHGYEWADAAIENCKCPDVSASTLRAAVMLGFQWERTKQGHEFWAKIHRSLAYSSNQNN